ncbi:MAG: radical SAM protein [Candidatus Pacearchaeota archaeon]|jgi:molybdenum cofactor biosynthesis enzyme MoaA|nr:radical SAM protein [Clostridia bacterium]
MEFKLFDKTIQLKDYYCEQKGYAKCPVERPYVNMYVQFRGCNANCPFCEFKDVATYFDLSAFTDAITEVSKKIEIRKISFTGGEPTLKLGNLIAAVNVARKKVPSAFRVLNTNGLNLNELYSLGLDKYLNSISLSRHHFDNDINNTILGFNAPTDKDITRIQKNTTDKFKLHLSCNIIKGHIDSNEKIQEYLEAAASMGIHDTGFVSLMKANEYAKSHYVDFSTIIETNNNLHNIKEWHYKDICKCNNYMYIPKNTNYDAVQTYSRCAIKPSCSTNLLVFDGANLREGFNGKVIY